MLRRLLSYSTFNSKAVAPIVGSRFLCTAKEEEVGCNDEGLLSKRALMQEEGFTEPQIQAVLAAQPRSDKLALLLTILKDRGITGATAGALVSSRSQLLRCNLNRFCSSLQVLEDAGISPALLKTSILKKWVNLSPVARAVHLQQHLPFLQDIGLSLQDSFTAMVRSQSLVRVSVEKRLKPLCEILCKKGVSKFAIGKLFVDHPYLFAASEAKFLEKIQVIEEFGLDLSTKNGVRALSLWSRYSVQKLRSKRDFLKTLGLTHEEATFMVRKMPCVLSQHEEKVKRKYEFYRYTTKLSLEYMMNSSALFTCSLEKRVLPRWAILQDLKERGLLKKPVSFAATVALPNKQFAKRFKVDPEKLL
ncbi:hypothetical protein GOP47_0027882 [Adiantum capillus-veneris]|nr:hypothetical protein GOP47_0027882 [Adiantum capillus-veneris]